MSLTSKILDIIAYIILGVAALIVGAGVMFAVIWTLVQNPLVAFVVGGVVVVSWALVRVCTHDGNYDYDPDL